MRAMMLWLVIVLAAVPAGAVEPDEVLADPALEERARDLSRQLRCVVCLNQDIDSSNADVARTMRLLLRERLVAGDSDAQVLGFFVERYGDFVLFRPPLKPSTYLLWVAPFLLIGAGIAVVGLILWRARGQAPGQGARRLDEGERGEIAALLDGEKGPHR